MAHLRHLHPTGPTARSALAAVAVAGIAALGTAGVPGPSAAAASLAWSTARTATAPPALADPAVAYDPDLGAVVLFGGVLAGGAPSNQTWEWNGTRWLQPSLAAAPPVRSAASLAFDAVHHQFLLFGGLDGSGHALADTWAFNGAQWIAQSTAQAPSPRYGAALAPNPGAQGGLVLFGGTGTAPSTPGTAAVAPTTLGDTWVWDGYEWTAGPQAGPSARTGATMALDGLHGQTVLFGGSPAPAGATPPATPLADTWTWNGSTWMQAVPLASPPGRSAAALVSDPQAGGLALAGGDLGGQVASDTWGWNGATWAALDTAGPPPARARAGAAFDTAAGTAVLVGGVDPSGAALATTALLGPAPVPPPTTTTAPPPTTGAPPPTGPPVTAPPHVPTAGPTTTAARPPASAPTLPQQQVASTTTVAPPPAAPAPAGPDVVHRGDRVVLLGGGFAPGATVTVSWHSTPRRLGTVVADGTGAVTTVAVVPAAATDGQHRFVLTGAAADGSTMQLSTPVEVVGAARPGTDPRTPVLLAISLVLPLATWLVLSVRSRRAAG